MKTYTSAPDRSVRGRLDDYAACSSPSSPTQARWRLPGYLHRLLIDRKRKGIEPNYVTPRIHYALAKRLFLPESVVADAGPTGPVLGAHRRSARADEKANRPGPVRPGAGPGVAWPGASLVDGGYGTSGDFCRALAERGPHDIVRVVISTEPPAWDRQAERAGVRRGPQKKRSPSGCDRSPAFDGRSSSCSSRRPNQSVRITGHSSGIRAKSNRVVPNAPDNTLHTAARVFKEFPSMFLPRRLGRPAQHPIPVA